MFFSSGSPWSITHRSALPFAAPGDRARFSRPRMRRALTCPNFANTKIVNCNSLPNVHRIDQCMRATTDREADLWRRISDPRSVPSRRYNALNVLRPNYIPCTWRPSMVPPAPGLSGKRRTASRQILLFAPSVAGWRARGRIRHKRPAERSRKLNALAYPKNGAAPTPSGRVLSDRSSRSASVD